MSREHTYSPVSAPRSSRKSPNKMSKFFHELATEKSKHLHITLGVITCVVFGLAVWFTWMRNKAFSQGEINNYKNMNSLINYSKSAQGKYLIIALWLLFIISVIPFSAGVWFRYH